MTDHIENSEIAADAKTAPAPSSEVDAAGQAESRNFEKEVHTWNPTLPMWRRSNKE